MEFDKSKVYTALNANELKTGSKCIFADTLYKLREKVQCEGYRKYVGTLVHIGSEDKTARFDNAYSYCFAYLIEPPKETEYKLFSSVEKAKEIIDNHGGWVKDKTTKEMIFVTSYSGLKINERDHAVIFIGTCWYSLNELYHNFVFADDGSPCGELVEE